MNRYLVVIAIFLFAASFASCDTSPFPIDSSPNLKIDSRLLGQWRVKNKHEEFTVIKNTDNTYMIIYKDWRTSDLEKFPAFLSDVNGVKFLNVNLVDEKKSGYLFVRILDINLTTNIVTACAVTDSMFQFLSEPDDPRKRITENLNNPAYYTDTTYFYRIIR